MDRRRLELHRRDVARMLLVMPAAPALARAQEKKPDEPPSPMAEFLVAQEKGLSPAEQKALRKSVAGVEKSLQVIRDFKLAPDVPPSFRFAARKSKVL
jgi:hypothetical protein